MQCIYHLPLRMQKRDLGRTHVPIAFGSPKKSAPNIWSGISEGHGEQHVQKKLSPVTTYSHRLTRRPCISQSRLSPSISISL